MDAASLADACVPLEELLPGAVRVELAAEALARVRDGASIGPESLPGSGGAPWLMAYPQGGAHAAAVLRRDAAGRYCPDRVFPPPPAG
jgi:hypothetical protein